MSIDPIGTLAPSPGPKPGAGPAHSVSHEPAPHSGTDRVEQSTTGGAPAAAPPQLYDSDTARKAAAGTAVSAMIAIPAGSSGAVGAGALDGVGSFLAGAGRLALGALGTAGAGIAAGAAIVLWPSPAGETPDQLQQLHMQPYPFAATTPEGARALADVKSDCEPNEPRQFDSFRSLKSAMKPQPNEQVHHLVEQNQTARFGTRAIQNTANAINLPAGVHAKISGYFSTKASAVGIDFQGTVREYIGTKSYAAQRQFGIDTTRSFVNSDATISPDEKARISKELDALENPRDPNACLPEHQ
jgi:hypothetical protein